MVYKEYGLQVRKECEVVIERIGPERSHLRQRRFFSIGPNFIWHLDLYDTLKLHGSCINGIFDGFSRLIIWLNVSTTNSDPKLIVGCYIEAVQQFGGLPQNLLGAILVLRMLCAWRESAPPTKNQILVKMSLQPVGGFGIVLVCRPQRYWDL